MTHRTVCVAGASGLVGAALVKALLAKNYQVHGTMRDKDDPLKRPHLMALAGAEERLTLHSADMSRPADFDPALSGCDGVFIACLIPTYRAPDGTPATELDDARGRAEIIQPTVDGCLNILRSAADAGVKTAVIVSSTSSTNPVPAPPVKNETDHWSDPEQQCAAKKYTSAAKPVMEQAAIAFCEQNGIRLSIMLPTLMLGPTVLPQHVSESYMRVFKQMLDGGPPRHDSVPAGSISMIHLEDMAALAVAAYENPNAQGRYFAVRDSWPWRDIYAELARLMPAAKRPAPLAGEPEAATRFDFTRRDSLGVPVRDVPTILRQMVDWMRTSPAA